MARTSQEDLDKMSFGRAFNTRRDELGGSGKTFTWRGKSYTTNLAEEAPRRGGRTGPATENAPTESRRPQARRSTAPEESQRPRPRSSITENIPSRRNIFRDPRDESPTTRAPARRNVERDAQDASPTTRARPPVRRDAQDVSPTRSAVTSAPESIQQYIRNAPNAETRSQAERIAEQVDAGRMPLRQALSRLGRLIPNLREVMAGRNTRMSERRSAAGMARGGMVKKGKTDLRGKGMFYDSKSPRGYK